MTKVLSLLSQLVAVLGRLVTACLCVLIFSVNSWAGDTGLDTGLVILEDRGGISIAPFFAPFEDGEYENENLIYEPTLRPDQPIKPFSEQDMLPVVTRSLSPRLMSADELDRLSQTLVLPDYISPFFVLGTDELSMEWLDARAPFLAEMGAVGIVVNVQTQAELEQLRQLAPGIEMRPTHGDAFADQLRLPGYPILISSTGLEQ